MNFEEVSRMKYQDLRRYAKGLGLSNMGKREVILKLVENHFTKHEQQQGNTDFSSDTNNKENHNDDNLKEVKLPQNEEASLANQFSNTVLIESSNRPTNKNLRVKKELQQPQQQTPNRSSTSKHYRQSIATPKIRLDQTVMLNSQTPTISTNATNTAAVNGLDATFEINRFTNSSTPILSSNNNNNNNQSNLTIISKTTHFNDTYVQQIPIEDVKSQQQNELKEVKTTLLNEITMSQENNNVAACANETVKIVIPTELPVNVAMSERMVEEKREMITLNEQPKKLTCGPRIVRPKDQNGNEIYQMKAGPRIIKPQSAQVKTSSSRPKLPTTECNELITDDESEPESFHEAPVLRPPKKGTQVTSSKTNGPSIVKPVEREVISSGTETVKLTKTKSFQTKEKPNFKIIHEKNAQSMESIDDHKKRLKQRYDSMQIIKAVREETSPIVKQKSTMSKEQSSTTTPSASKLSKRQAQPPPPPLKTPQTAQSPTCFKFDGTMLNQQQFNFDPKQQPDVIQKERQARPIQRVILTKQSDDSSNTTLVAPVLNSFQRRKSYDPNASQLQPLGYNPYKGKLKQSYMTSQNPNGSILGSTIFHSQQVTNLNTTQQQSRRISNSHVNLLQITRDKKVASKELKQKEEKRVKKLNSQQKTRAIDASIMQ